MSYVQESLSPGEKIFKITNYHWMYLMSSFIGAGIFIIAAFGLLFLGIIYHYYDATKVPPWMIHKAAAELAFRDYLNAFWHMNLLFRVSAFLLILMAFIQVGAKMLVIATTEMAVTNRRVVFKRGLVARKIEEMRIDYIESDDVNQTVMGRLFNYGQIKVYGTGSDTIFFPIFTLDPINFRRALETARNNIHVIRSGPPNMPPPAAMAENHHNAQPGETQEQQQARPRTMSPTIT